MKILVNGKIAALKKGSSFEYVSENRSFTDADDYSLSISFPLADCPDNIAIFGHLNRTDIDKTQVVFDCEISDIYFYKAGVITITEISNTEIKAQFLEGRSASNYDISFDDIYINELELGSPVSTIPPSNPNDTWRGLILGQEYVALPWVNNTSGNIQNDVVFADGIYKWGEDVSNLSFFPYLIVITKRICEALGYEYDFAAWDNSEDKKYLIICNALPAVWDIPQFARALPHWSVTEYFEKLEQFLGCEFDINHKAKTISLTFTKTILSSASTVSIENVLDSFTSEVTTDDESNYIEYATIRYKESDHQMQKFYSCRWLVQGDYIEVVNYDTLDELLIENKQFARCRTFYRGSTANKILYAKDVDTYFVIRCLRNEQELVDNGVVKQYYTYRICTLQPINIFGDKVVSEDISNEIELDFVPVCIDETEESKGNCIFLNVGDFDESALGEHDREPTEEEEQLSDVSQPVPINILDRGEQNSKTEYFDKINVAFWDGAICNVGKLPVPIIDRIRINPDWTYSLSPYSLRLVNSSTNPVFDINPKQKYSFSFLMNEMPDVRSVFYINGKKYLCEKITTTFTENGISQLKKGVFYRIID